MRRHSQSGSVVLVAFCFVAVLAIALASYLALSHQAMTLGSRVYEKDVSKSLAEMGLECALRSYTADSFAGWTHPDAITATKTISIPADRYGSSGIAATVNIRVDHYRGTNRAVVWSFIPNYVFSDYVWYQGVWYNCIGAPPAHETPANSVYWKAAPEFWNAYSNYEAGNLAVTNGRVYRCISPNINLPPPANPIYWTFLYNAALWSSATSYSVDAVVLSGGVAYRCVSGNTNHAPPNSTYWLSAPVIYAEGVATLTDNSSTAVSTQLRALIAPAPLFPNAVGSREFTTLLSNGTVDSYNSSIGTYASQNGTALGASTNYSAVLAGADKSTPSVSAVKLGSATLKGYIAAPSDVNSPYAPRWDYGAGSSVSGTALAVVDLTRVSRSPNVPQFDILPVTGGTDLPAGEGDLTYLHEGNRTLGTPGATIPSKYNITKTYAGAAPFYDGIYLDDSTDVLNIIGPVILNVTGDLYVNGGQIIIASTGSLEVYFTGQIYIGTNTPSGGGIINQSPDSTNPDPKRLLLVGTNATNTPSYHYLFSAQDFCGLVYMPNAYFALWNLGGNYVSTQRYGAFSARNVYFTHAANFHYDTTLRTAGSVGTFIEGPYLVSDLRELSNPDERITFP